MQQTVVIKVNGSDDLSVVSEQRVAANCSLSDISPIDVVVLLVVRDSDRFLWFRRQYWNHLMLV